MVIEPSYWLLLPTGVLIATAYTSTGISGANFWVPVFLLWLGLDTAVGFWLALVVLMFGSLSGLARHAWQGTIAPRTSLRVLSASVPMAVVGALVAPLAPPWALSGAFGVFALTFGLVLVLGREPASTTRSGDSGRRALLLTAGAGGLLTGAISVGLGALLLPRMLAGRDGAHHATAVGTSLLAVFLTSLAAALARLRGEFVDQLGGSLPEIFGVMVFVVPAVIVGGQLGPILARWLPRSAMRRYASLLLIVIGVLMLGRLAFAG